MRYIDFIITVEPKTIFESCRRLEKIELVRSGKNSERRHVSIAVGRECNDLPKGIRDSLSYGLRFVLRGGERV